MANEHTAPTLFTFLNDLSPSPSLPLAMDW